MINDVWDINNESEVKMYITQKSNSFISLINELIKEQCDFIGCEYTIHRYDDKARIVYGGGRVDMMFASDNFLIPVEIKYRANYDSLHQLEKYMSLLEKLYSNKPFGVLVSKTATKDLIDRVKKEKNIALCVLTEGVY